MSDAETDADRSANKVKKCSILNFNGACCCNCIYHVEITKHPWNKSVARGSVTDILGWGCQTPDGKIVFHEKEHGMCEHHMYTI